MIKVVCDICGRPCSHGYQVVTWTPSRSVQTRGTLGDIGVTGLRAREPLMVSTAPGQTLHVCEARDHELDSCVSRLNDAIRALQAKREVEVRA